MTVTAGVGLAAGSGLVAAIRGVFTDGASPLMWPLRFDRGINISGMEFSEKTYPGIEGMHYFAPQEADFAYASRKGFTVARIPFLWERAQPTLNGALAQVFLQQMDFCVAMGKKYRIRLIPDMHNYGGRYVDPAITAGERVKIGSATLTIAHFVDFWTKFATRYKNEPFMYGYDLMNEPVGMPVECNPMTYNPFTPSTQLQLIPNYKFAADLSGWSADSAYVRKTDPAVNGGNPFIEYTGVSGNFSNFTTANDSTSGLSVAASTTYIISGTATANFTGNYPQIQVNTGADNGQGHAYPGTTLASYRFVAAATETRWSFQFTTAADTKKVWIRFQGLGGIGLLRFMKLNITKDSTVQPYRDFAYNSQTATTSLMNQAAITAIRTQDMNVRIIMENDKYAGLHQFTANFGANPDPWWNDPANKTMPSFHYYQDPEHRGVYEAAGAQWTQATRDRLRSDCLPAFQWCRQRAIQPFMGEIGVPSRNDTSGINYRIDLGTLLGILDEFEVPATYYAMGRNYTSEISVSPESNYTVDKSQMPILTAHLGK